MEEPTGFLQSCPICGNEQDYNTEAEADEDWKTWRAAFIRCTRRGVRRVFDFKKEDPDGKAR